MDGVEEFVQFREGVRNGPFFCGDSTSKGRTIMLRDLAQKDNIARYSDRYVTPRRIGNTAQTYPYFTSNLGPQLSSFIGLKQNDAPSNLNGQSDANVEKFNRINQVLGENGEEEEVEKDDEDAEEVEQDEFEEFEDDDYNAEKYFDDGGDDMGDIDEAGEPDYS